MNVFGGTGVITVLDVPHEVNFGENNFNTLVVVKVPVDIGFDLDTAHIMPGKNRAKLHVTVVKRLANRESDDRPRPRCHIENRASDNSEFIGPRGVGGKPTHCGGINCNLAGNFVVKRIAYG